MCSGVRPWCRGPRSWRRHWRSRGLAAPVLAEDAPAPTRSAHGAVMAPAEPAATGASPAAGSPRTPRQIPASPARARSRTCSMPAPPIIASGSTDTDKIVAAHGNRAIGLSATKDYDRRRHRDERGARARPERAQPLFHAVGRLPRQEGSTTRPSPTSTRPSARCGRGDYYMLRGMIFGDQGDLDRAIAELDQKVKLDPKSTQAIRSAPSSIGRRRTTTAPSGTMAR